MRDFCLNFLMSHFFQKSRLSVAAFLIVGCIITNPVGIVNAATVSVCTASELSSAIAGAKPGDRIEMCDGHWSDIQIIFDGSGTKESPITLTTQSPGGVILTGSSTLALGGSFLVVDGLRFEGPSEISGAVIEFLISDEKVCRDCRVTNVTIKDYSPSDPSKSTKWVRLRWGDGNRIDHSHFTGKTNQGAVIQVKRDEISTPNNARIDHNLIEDRPNMDDHGSNGDTVEIGSVGWHAWSDSKSIFEFNYLRNIFSDYEALTVKSSGNTIRYNVIEASRGNLSLRHGYRNLIQGNFIFGRGEVQSGGIRVQGSGHIIVNNYVADVNPNDNAPYAAIGLRGGRDEMMDTGGDGKPTRKYEEAVDVLVAHNTVVNSGDSIVFGDGIKPNNNKLVNNLVDRGKGPAIDAQNMGVNTEFSSNLVYAESAGLSDPGVQFIDPQLVADEMGIDRPVSSSPAIDKADITNLDLPDMDGQIRSGTPDIGADEVISGSKSRGAIPLCAVGPRTYRIGLPAVCNASAWNNIRPMPPQLVSAD